MNQNVYFMFLTLTNKCLACSLAPLQTTNVTQVFFFSFLSSYREGLFIQSESDSRKATRTEQFFLGIHVKEVLFLQY